ncbi:MAG: tetratricopeptide repeat protein [Microscillaceae bacterium]|jgi:tetratricopeptide (TPR) repeat protein|nr:tetratricopeptide repeat protein [Microscillaceae bacterium]
MFKIITQLLCWQLLFFYPLFAQTPQQFLETGKQKAEAGAYAEAIQDFSSAIQKSSQFEEAYYCRGEALMNLGRFDEALSDFSKTISLQPQESMNYYMRGMVNFELQKLQDALWDFNKVIELTPTFELALVERAKVNLKLKRYQLAWEDCQKVLTASRNFPEALSMRGLIQLEQGKYEEAYQDLIEATKQRPNSADFWVNLAEYYLAKKQVEKANETYTAALRIDPNHYRAYYQRAALKLSLGNYVDAQKDAHKAILNYRRFLPAYVIRGIASFQLNERTRYEYDFNYYSKAIQTPEENYFLANYIYQYGKGNEIMELAESCAQKAVQAKDTYENNLLYASILFKMNKTAPAREYANRASQIARKNRLENQQAENLLVNIGREDSDRTPPVIRITSPSSAMRGIITVESADKITVIGTVMDDSGIDRVLINGNPARLDGNNFDGETVLTGEDTQIMIRAYDNRGNMATKVFSVKKTNPAKPQPVPVVQKPQIMGKNRALLFATNEYDYWSPLVNPIFDAEAIAKDLQLIYNFEVELIKNPTKEDITLKIKSYAKKQYDANDQLFIFFAGHGQFDEVFKEGYIVARDTKEEEKDEAKSTYLAHSNLRTYINSIPCKHIFLTMDVCFGGTFNQLVAMRGNSNFGSDREEFINRKLRFQTRKYLTSGGKEYVPDGKAGQHSPFARKFLEALRSEGGADRILTIGEILEFLSGVKPQPHAGEFGNDEPGSDFIFIGK